MPEEDMPKLHKFILNDPDPIITRWYEFEFDVLPEELADKTFEELLEESTEVDELQMDTIRSLTDGVTYCEEDFD